MIRLRRSSALSRSLPSAARARRTRLRRVAILTVLVATAGCASPPPAELWLSTADGTLRLARQPDVAVAGGDTAGVWIDVHDDSVHQEMVGFGAAVTDAAAWLIQTRLSPAQREALLQELFGRDSGLGLSFTRLTIGASDFSRAHYTLADAAAGERDTALARFSIEPNRADVLPVVRRALAINPQLRVMASPWSAPAWMKTTGSLVGGTLRPEAYGAYAEYLRRYVAAYEAEGVPIYAITVQNEPHHEPPDYPGMRLTPPQRAEFLKHHLGPLFARHGVRARVLEWDHNWDEPESPLAVLSDSAARRHVAGVAWHCYAGDVSAQSRVHDAHPDKDTYFTECTGGEWATDWGGNLAWNVRHLIIGATRHWARGVLLWNLALDERHGPHLGGCTDCRGVVTIHSGTGAVTRNVEYYALAHASRFVRPGARRIGSTSGVQGVESVAFRNVDDGSRVLVALNGAAEPRTVLVRAAGHAYRVRLPAGAVATLRWP